MADWTLLIPLGALNSLDREFATLREKERHQLKGNPVQPWSGVLLGANGPKDAGDLYVFAGVLLQPRYDPETFEITFADAKRFWHPVVAIYGAVGIRREDLVGDLQAWGPYEYHYVPSGIVERVMVEAEESLRRIR